MIAPGQEISLRVRRDGKQLNLTATLATPPELVPDVLPAARAEAAEQSEDRPPVGTIEPKLPEFKNKAAAYIPTAYHSEAACGVLVWLHAPGGPSGKKMIERFKPFCDRHNFVLLAPRSADPKRWQRDETAVVAGLLRQLATKYTIDPTRIVVAGRQGGGGMAYLTAFGLRDVIRGVATISSPMPRAATPPATDPVRSLSFYSASILWIWKPMGEHNDVWLSGCLRVGPVMAALWLALPQLDRIPNWLTKAGVLLVLFLATAQGKFRIVIVALAAYLIVITVRPAIEILKKELRSGS